MTHQIVLVAAKEVEAAEYILMLEIPDDPGDGHTVSNEMNRVVQRAYEMGRLHQIELHERAMHALFAASKKSLNP